MNVQRWAFLLIAAIVSAVLYKISTGGGNPIIDKSPGVRVTVVSPKSKSLNDKLTATGATIPQEDVIVITELSGLRITKVFAEAGQSVKAGDVLAELDREALKSQLQQIESDFERIRDDYSRSEKLKDTGVISKATIQQKETALEVATAKLSDAQLNLKRTQVIAPVDGIIYERKADIGELAAANQPLFRLSRNGLIEFEAKIPEARIRDIKQEMPASIKLSGSQKPVAGTVRIIIPAIDPINRLAMARIRFATESQLPVGLFGTAEITLGDISGFSLPATAIQKDNSGSFVWVVTPENRVQRLAVTTIYQDTQEVLVENISTDLKIVAKAGAFVNEGEIVVPVAGE